MNAGAAKAKGAALVFLHTDTRLPADADVRILDALKNRRWAYWRRKSAERLAGLYL